MTPLSGVVAAFAQTSTLTVNRPGAVSMVNGRRVAGASSPVAGIVGSVWPVTGDSVGVSDDGRRLNNQCQVFTLQALQVADDSTGLPGNVVTHLGVDYEILERQPWVRGAFYAYIGRDINHP